MHQGSFARGALLCASLLSAACGKLSEEEFVYSYTESYCTKWLDCVDPALAVFDGIDSAEACEADIGNTLGDRANLCKLVRRNAEDCLLAMADMSCPSDGKDLDTELPSVCSFVWKNCDPSAEVSDDQPVE